MTVDENFGSCGSPVTLTSYSSHVGHPKIVQMDAGKYLLMWELFNFSTQRANTIVGGQTGYASTHMLVIDERGRKLTDILEVAGARLNMNDVLRYNRQNGKVYWSINDSNNSITTYALEIGRPGTAAPAAAPAPAPSQPAPAPTPAPSQPSSPGWPVPARPTTPAPSNPGNTWPR